MSLPQWGRFTTVLIGDAAHAMQPWAGVGATLAAEDGYVLATLLAEDGFDDLPKVFRRLQEMRLDRVRFSYHMTLNNTPEGLLPEDLSLPVDRIIDRFGDHRSLQASPAWAGMLASLSRQAA